MSNLPNFIHQHINIYTKRPQKEVITTYWGQFSIIKQLQCQLMQRCKLIGVLGQAGDHRIHQNILSCSQMLLFMLTKSIVNFITLFQIISNKMPRAQKLSELTPNKVYSIQGVLKFIHQSPDYTTAVIQQDNIQRKIKIPLVESQLLVQGRKYKFSNCFYNSQGWLMARKPHESISPIRPSEQQELLTQTFTLEHIHLNIHSLQTNYLSTYLRIYDILPQQSLSKNGKDIRYQVLKGYSSNRLIDVTIWNGELKTEALLNRWVLFEGMKVKHMTENKFVLISTVFTKMAPCEWEIGDEFEVDKLSSYQNLSQIYKQRILQQLAKMQIPSNKIFSVVNARVKGIVQADYDGCPKCRRKIEQRCDMCNLSTKTKYSYGKVTLEDNQSTIQVIVFEEKIRQLFKFAKENCSIQCQIKTFGRVEQGETVISHILTKINSIFF